MEYGILTKGQALGPERVIQRYHDDENDNENVNEMKMNEVIKK